MAGSEMDELIEGKLQLKKSPGGYRHYIKDGDTDRDICCGNYMEVKLIDDHLGGWLKGRYEARLTEPVEAYLVIGDFYLGGWFPGRYQATITIPRGVVVRVRNLAWPGVHGRVANLSPVLGQI